MGFFAGLNDEKYDRQYTDRELLRRILEYFKPQATRFVWVLRACRCFGGDRRGAASGRCTNGGFAQGTAIVASDQPGEFGGAPDWYWSVGIELGAA